MQVNASMAVCRLWRPLGMQPDPCLELTKSCIQLGNAQRGMVEPERRADGRRPRAPEK
jgi:hypothetical protein